jgi:thiol-disulfide isomerase/thioredoxin
MLAGRVQAIPPQPRLMIRLRDDLASNTVPPVPGKFGPSVQPAGGVPNSPPLPLPGSGNDIGWTPGGSPSSANVTPSAPENVNIPSPRIPLPSQDTENIAGGNNRPPAPAPLITVPGPGSPAKLPDPDPVPNNPGSNRISTQSAIPSCTISGNRVTNLTLKDLNGETWDLRSRYRKLVLIDFWGTWCMHCLRAMPELENLQRQYGAYGLEVVGIACEYGTDADTVQRVRDVVKQKRVQYEIVLADPVGRCPVQNQFYVRKYPTLVLLDENGTILWRGEGAQIDQVRAIIQQQLRR